MKKLLAIAALMTAAAAVPAQAQVVNGDFETPATYSGGVVTNLPGWNWSPTGNQSVVTANSAAYNGIGGTGSTGTGTFLVFNGGDSPNGGSISQTLALGAGAYKLSFLFGTYGGFGSSQVIQYSVAGSGGTRASGSLPSFGTTDLSALFATLDHNFTTTGGPVTLTFTDASSTTNSVDLFLDNVTIAAVPEPSTWALMVGGFGMMGLAIRRRRRPATAFA